VNHVRQLSNGGGLFITSSRWHTPNGRLIEQVGLTPDIEVPISREDVDAGRDPQLDKALELLRQQVLTAAPAS
jgi:carboxyl-terminal processing protease